MVGDGEGSIRLRQGLARGIYDLDWQGGVTNYKMSQATKHPKLNNVPTTKHSKYKTS
jgi:hypothetical protein